MRYIIDYLYDSNRMFKSSDYMAKEKYLIHLAFNTQMFTPSGLVVQIDPCTWQHLFIGTPASVMFINNINNLKSAYHGGVMVVECVLHMPRPLLVSEPSNLHHVALSHISRHRLNEMLDIPRPSFCHQPECASTFQDFIIYCVAAVRFRAVLVELLRNVSKNSVKYSHILMDINLPAPSQLH